MPFPPGPRFWEGRVRVAGAPTGWGGGGGAPGAARVRHDYPLVPMNRPAGTEQNFQPPFYLSARLYQLAQFPVLHDAGPDLRPGLYTAVEGNGNVRRDEAYYAHERGIDAAAVVDRPAFPGGVGAPCGHCAGGFGPFLTCRIMPTRPTLNGGINELNDACTNCFYLGGGRAPVAAGVGNRANQCSIATVRKFSKLSESCISS
jgi:hypothetical protein